MRKKNILIISVVLLLFAGIIALTQELDLLFSDSNGNEETDESDFFDFSRNEKEPAKWFRSNAGGMALEEMQSQIIALRSEYSLAIESAHWDELPIYLFPYYNDEYFIEVRMLYKNREQIRTQWLFKDINGVTRLNAVIFELEEDDENEENKNEEINVDISISEENEENEESEQYAETENAESEQYVEVQEKRGLNIKGFIELFDENSGLLSEYRYLENGRVERVDYLMNNNLLISSTVMYLDGEEYKKAFVDNYRYNRSLALRAIERVFFTDMQIELEDLSRVTVPRRLMDAAREQVFISERLNLYPDFFGDIYVESNSKMIFDSDDKGRIVKQTLFDEEDNIIWTIQNTWDNNRIVSTAKTEGETVLLAEFRYDSGGDRILERNYTNGVLERVVRADGNIDIEELYMNNVVVLRAVWEEGRKISETRVIN